MMTENNFPKVSVCIPTYNYGEYLPDAIESVLNQTFKDFELIVVDNCSTDNTKEIVSQYVLNDSRVQYYCNESNVGMVGNWNRCLGLANGIYIKILCADDYLELSHLEKCLEVLQTDDSVVLTSTPRIVFSCENGTKRLSFSDQFIVVEGNDAIKRCLLEWNVIGEPSAVLFRKSAVNSLFDHEFEQVADLEMWFRILERGKLASIPDTSCYLRCHNNQTTHINLQNNAISLDELKLFSIYLRKEYIDIVWYKKQELMFFRAYSYWMQWRTKLSKKEVLNIMSNYYNPILFKTLLGLKKLKTLVLNKCTI